ncbi:hypothetical protein REPUB_Repub13aG0057500 [Reevesia pubescens]
MGEELSPALLGAIAASKISIIILPKGYASSSWCLTELCEIMEMYTKGSQLVVPIFSKGITVYNEVSAQFDSYCFLEHAREDSQKGGGIIYLRDKLFSQIFNEENFHIDTPIIGSKFTLDRLGRKRVLVVLDDELSDDNSLQLFSLYAFKQNHPVVGFKDLSKRVLQYAKGVPIALKVLGSTLYQRRIDYWENSVKEILDSCYYVGAAHCGIDDLVDKCLVTVTKDCNLIWMHDLLQEMGRDVVYKESEDPGKRSRLWNPKDVCAVFKNNKDLSEKY